ncbi:MAG: hypothetical protein EOP83_32025, partial [Verrucomicrobiaceae bacterium]
MQDSRFPLAFLAGAIALAGAVGGLYVYRGKPAAAPTPPAPVVVEEKKPDPKPDNIPANQKESVVDGPVDPEAALANAGVGLAAVDPAELLGKIGTA